MFQQTAILNFPKSLIGRPVISHVIKNYDVEVNILQATITPQEDGHMFTIFSGKKQSVLKALDYLSENEVQIIKPEKNLVRDEARCVHCTACVGQCISNAYTVDPTTYKVVYNADHCIACKLCIDACAFGAVESIGDHLKRTGGL